MPDTTADLPASPAIDTTVTHEAPLGQTTAGVPAAARRGPVDPVKTLMHRHRELCARAVDSLEIAAGLEAHGLTDRTAARFRHRDVFSLAEEMYARVPRGEPAITSRSAAVGAAGWVGPVETAPGAASLLPALLPGAVAIAGVTALDLGSGLIRVSVAAGATLALAAALVGSLRRGPLRAPGRAARFGRLWVGLLLAFSVAGGGLLARFAGGRVHSMEVGDLWQPTVGLLLSLALAVAPAALSAWLFARAARSRLGGSRGLEDFAAGVRPLVLAVVALYAIALTALVALVGLVQPVPAVAAVALGLLLFLARLLTVHGFARSACMGLAAAAAAEVLALACVLVGRLPGCGALARPVESAVLAWGPGAVPALACGAAALGLLFHATAALSRASAHTP
ncbi:hypothetical protein V1460_07100 [Streptomyces sp. SCSIO 30461]|uniref:hypothetical protein n=1 Tax=Streptomyces sp. SCSIO 30461 TaxID=3118085 RepID=UPI0030D16E07